MSLGLLVVGAAAAGLFVWSRKSEAKADKPKREAGPQDVKPRSIPSRTKTPLIYQNGNFAGSLYNMTDRRTEVYRASNAGPYNMPPVRVYGTKA